VAKATQDVKKGVVIVSRPNGEILSLVSKPSFDPNLFTLDETYKTSSTSAYHSLEGVLLDNDNQPLLNRAIGGIYPPGSTFKLVTAISGLENKVIDRNFSITDTGILRVGDFSYANWFYTDYGKTEPGKVDIIKAISRSNDIFFYKLAEKVGVDRLSETGKKFGLGQPLGIDLGGESAGLLPTKQWKEKEIGEKWYLGDDFHYGIGQGYLLTTPLQVNSWTETIANGGTLYEPRLFLEQDSHVKNQGLVSKKTNDLLREGMIQACSPGGVAFPLFDFTVKNKDLKIDGNNITQAASKSADFRKISVACKTGTAQHGGEKTLPHAWITLFAPAYNPQVVVTVLVESGGEGSKVAAPIAKKVLDAYFGK
jgi:penicillin-binding protein 2